MQPDDDERTPNERETRRPTDIRALAAENYDEEPNRTVTEQRVDTIVDMMCAGKWVAGVTDRQLAELWNLSRERVQNLASEANRVIRRMLREDPESKKAALARVLQNFERLAFKAESSGDLRGLQVALDANKNYATFLGLLPAQKLALEQDESPFHGWTREEKEHFAATGEFPKRSPRGSASR